MRGDKICLMLAKLDPIGSPPHARGQVRPKLYMEQIIGITPACAGTRARWPRSSMPPWDHPRMRGDKSSRPTVRQTCTGSPPACAGTRVRYTPYRTPSRDHPRMRGDKFTVRLLPVKLTGSPPHARGQAVFEDFRSVPTRITPACAGIRHCAPLRRHRYRDHPRVRGDKMGSWLAALSTSGSPPRARG